MIDALIDFSIRHRWVVLAACLLLALAGVWALYQTPVDAIPDLSENQVIVFTDWPGHSPREVEDQVTYPLSLQLQGVAGVRTVRSSSDPDFSRVHVIFDDSVEFAVARSRVAERLPRAAASMPAGVTPALAPDAAATGQIYWYTVEGPGYDLGRLRDVQDWYVKPQLQSVPGVAEVASVGGFPSEYQVAVNPDLLRSRGVTLAEVVGALSRSNGAVGGSSIHKGNAEFLVRGVGWLGQGKDGEFDPERARRDLENVPVPRPDGNVRVGDVATVTRAPRPRRGVLEKEGSEVAGGVVLMRQGENPLEVTRRIKEKVQELQPGLPEGVRVVSFYDRTPLIEGAVGTVTGTLLEAIVTAVVLVVLVLRHLRTSFVIALTLPLAVLATFAALWLLRRVGLADVQTNVMSLAGIAVSIGVLVDSSVVMAENVMHHLHQRFGDRPVTGDTRELIRPACRAVGRPIFFSVVIMLLSFLPVFALGGLEGKMFRPLAYTKALALLAVAVLAVTLVPALCTFFVRGRLRGEMDNWLVRSVILAYRPVLNYCLRSPAPLVWLLGATLVVGLAPLGIWWVSLLGVLAALVGILCWAARTHLGRAVGAVLLAAVAVVAGEQMRPLGREFLTPLDEGMVMDMPITVPRASVVESGDDVKARDMVFCRFPEVDMVVGKAGRAETPTDPAPLDMIETMVNFRPPDLWPRRHLRTPDAEAQARRVLDGLRRQGLVGLPEGATADALVSGAVAEALPLFDAQMREFAYQDNEEFQRELAPQLTAYLVEQEAALLRANRSLTRDLTPSDVALVARSVEGHHGGRHLAMMPTLEDVTWLARQAAARMRDLELLRPDADALRYRADPLSEGAFALHAALGGSRPTFFTRLHEVVLARHRALWREHVAALDARLQERGPALFTRLVLEATLARATVTDDRVQARLRAWQQAHAQAAAALPSGGGHHHGAAPGTPPPTIDPVPELDRLEKQLTDDFARRVWLVRLERAELASWGGELDRVMQMPGWTNVWTMPIQNRVDMLATGVNTTVGVRVLGRRLDDVAAAADRVAEVVKRVPGAADVVADPVVGKGYLEVRLDRDKALRYGVSAGDVNDLVAALGGKEVATTVEGRERHPVTVRLGRSWREDEEAVRGLPVPVGVTAAGPRGHVALADVADVRVVEGPASIKSENGLLRSYVRLNVRGRSAGEFVEEAKRAVAERGLPEGTYAEWTGQFVHEEHAAATLLVIVPVAVVLIFLVLWWTYRDLADALLLLPAVAGAVAGGFLCQWLFGAKFSVTVWVGYVACFGMATATGIIMLVYLRQAVEKAGGLANLTADQLRQAVLDGAVHRLRPKLLTEATTMLGLMPLLWATGVGAEVIRPMVLPVLGGLFVADEVIDLLLPVLFYHVRRRRWERLRRQPASPAS